jgi:hypothetical protein
MIFSKAIQSLRPGAEFSIINDDISTIVWHTVGITTPTQEEIDNEIKRLEEEKAAKEAAKTAAKESAQAKLTALGLSDEEIAAITNN